jgi:type II secretory pathway component PulJ
MKILLTIILTALITWGASSVFHTIKIRIDRTVHFTDVIRPLQVAMSEIQRDMNEGKTESMEQKIDFLSEQVFLLETEINDNSLNPIFDEYRKINQQELVSPEPVR